MTAGAPFDIFTVFFAYPAHAGDIPIKNRRKFAATKASDVDVLTRFAGDRQNFVNGEIRMIAPIALKTGQPLQLHGSEQIVLLKQCGAGVVNAGVSHEDELRHWFQYFEGESCQVRLADQRR